MLNSVSTLCGCFGFGGFGCASSLPRLYASQSSPSWQWGAKHFVPSLESPVFLEQLISGLVFLGF